MDDFRIEKVAKKPSYSFEKVHIKKGALTLAIIISLCTGCERFFMAGTPPPPPPPIVNIYVKLSSFDNATNLWEPAGGVTNAIYAVGDFGGLTVNGVQIPTWDPASTVAHLTKVTLDIYKLQLPNNLTNDAFLTFKFVNGTPGFGGTWANEEQEFTDSGLAFEGIANRTLDILKGLATNIYMTNDILSNVGGTAMGCITHWKGVGPTYKSTNVTFNITFINNLITNVVGTNISPGDYVLLHGSFYYSSFAVTSNQVQADDSVTMTFLYNGVSSVVSYFVCPSQGIAAQRVYDNYGSEFIYAVPFAQSVSGTVVVTNSGAWRSW
jgi:hypothetical protein